MKRLMIMVLAAGGLAGPSLAGRDISTVRDYVIRAAGEKALQDIRARKGGEKFLQTFLNDQDWLEQFAGSGRPGTFCPGPSDTPYAAALEALDLLVWNDAGGFADTRTGRLVLTAIALDHGGSWPAEKMVELAACYRDWVKDGTLHDSAFDLDVWGWREVLCMGQNAELPIEDLRFVHDFAFIPESRYRGICWACPYRGRNCFGASVHRWMYYAPWSHLWKTQELRQRIGAVCGGLSKFGAGVAASHGVRAFTSGQPGHCAYMVWSREEKRWMIAYSVTGHTRPHFSLGGANFQSLEEQARYYLDPKRMAAEHLRWKGDYAGAMRLVHGNWNAASDWMDAIKKNPSDAEWDRFGAVLCETFAESPCQGWQLYFNVVDACGNDRARKIETVRKGLLAFHENPAATSEGLYFDAQVLNPIADRFKNDTAALWEILPAALDGQAKSERFYNGVVAWASGRFMGNAEDVRRFLGILGASSSRNQRGFNGRDMVLKASAAEEIETFNLVYDLIAKISPDALPKTDGRSYPTSKYGGELLSQNGMLKISSTSKWDSPLAYKFITLAEEYPSASFHTGKETSPWSEVVLPGKCEIRGVTVVNAGNWRNHGRQVPLEVSVSTDGKTFTKVWSSEERKGEWEAALDKPVEAKYVRVGRTPGARNDVFHLHKILVYGKKLY